MDTGFDDFFAQQDRLMALPEEDVDSYLARRAKHDEPCVSPETKLPYRHLTIPLDRFSWEICHHCSVIVSYWRIPRAILILYTDAFVTPP